MAWDRTNRPAWLRYTAAIVIAMLAAAIRWQFLEVLQFRVLFVTFFPAVAIVALYGGFGPGLVATVVSAALADYFWLMPLSRFNIAEFADKISLGLFLVSAILISYLAEVAFRAQAQAAHEAEEQWKLAADRQKTELEKTKLIQVRLDLIEYAATHTLDELLSKALDEIGRIVESPIGFYQFVEKDQKTLSLQQWSTQTLSTFCKAKYKGRHYSIDEAGVWADAVRQGKAVIHNDYDSLENKKGVPEGHAKVVRELVVPVMREGRVVAVVGVGNRLIDYTEKDAETVTYLSDVTWEIIERKRDEGKIRQNEITFRTVLDQLPSGVTVRDVSTGALILANVKGREIAGTLPHDASQLPLYRFFYPDGRQYRVEDWPFHRSMTTGEIVDAEEVEYERADGARLTVCMSSAPIRDLQGQIIMSASVFNDITERKLVEQGLRESEARLDLALRSAGMGTWHWDIAENKRYHDDQTSCLLGVDSEAFTGLEEEFFRMLDPRDVKTVKRALSKTLDKDVPYASEFRVIKPGGEVRYIASRGKLVRDDKGRPMKLNGLIWDITDRSRMEDELRRSRDELELRVKERTADLESANEKLRRVPSKLIEAQEKERQRLAFELHDSIGQTIAALKFRVEHVITALEKMEYKQAFHLLNDFVPVLQRSIDETRAIYMGLRPMILSEYGIVATLEWYRQEFLKLYSNHHIELETSIREQDIPEELKIAIFRIAQEALNNVCRHSKAEWVDVRLALNDGAIELEIGDDGIGMDLDYIMESRSAKSLGLLGMKERAELTGGEFTIKSTLNEGTTVRACWPLAPVEKILLT